MRFQSLVLVFILVPTMAFSSGKGGEDEHQLSVSGGIASPSFSSAVFQNPAGLVYNSKFKGTAQATLNDFNNLYGGVLGGNGSFGAAGGVGHGFQSGGSTSAFYGLGVQSDSLKIAVGLAGFTDLGGGGSTFNAGVLLGPSEKLTLGLTAIGLNSSVREWGAGIAVRLSGVTGLILDSTVDSGLNNFAIQPGVIVGNEKAALTFSYGLGVANNTEQSWSTRLTTSGYSRQLSGGFAAGGSLRIGSSASWQVYYNQLAKWYTAISIDI